MSQVEKELTQYSSLLHHENQRNGHETDCLIGQYASYHMP